MIDMALVRFRTPCLAHFLHLRLNRTFEMLNRLPCAIYFDCGPTQPSSEDVAQLCINGPSDEKHHRGR